MKLSRLILFLAVADCASASDLDTIGLTLLRQFDPSLNGAGIPVAQPEAPDTGGGNDFEINPASVGQPANLFTWYNSIGTSANTFPNSVGTEPASKHGDVVGSNFYGITNGAATNVSHLYNYNANYFLNASIAVGSPVTPARVVNQSFTLGSVNTTVDQDYDNYAATHNTVFVSGAEGNAATFTGPIYTPANCFNGIAAGIYNNPYTGLGPTTDGRCKPDLISPDAAQSPGSAVSYSTAYVSATAAILLQAAVRNDGGAGTASSATNLATIKALLLNGAFKPSGWTNGPTRPLDARYGAGVVNAFNSWNLLRGGKHPFIETTTNTPGTTHPPGANPANEAALAGWDYNSLTTSGSGASMKEVVNHYYFNLPPTNGGPYTLTATVAWNRQSGKTTVNDLNLFLFNTANSNLVLASTSAVDNVEHLFVPVLPSGRYDLQVQKSTNTFVTAGESYGLAFDFLSLRLNVARTNGNLVLSWPVVPTGFTLLSAASLNPPVIWSAVAAPVTVNTNSRLNSVTVPATGGAQFFRLQAPWP